MDWNNFCEQLNLFLGSYKRRFNFLFNDENISYDILDDTIVYTKESYEELLTKAENYNFKPYSILDSTHYESLIDISGESRRYLGHRFEGQLENYSLSDAENGVTYSFKPASNELIYYIIKTYEDGYLATRLPSSFLSRKLEQLEDKSLFCFLRTIMSLPFSFCANSETSISGDKIIQYSKSHLFNFAYNLGVVFKPIIEKNELFSQRTMRRNRTTQNIEDISAPHLLYKPELTEQYYMALSSADPFVKYIGFYHIIEYFFEDVYNEDILESVKKKLQHPSFSVKRKKDLTAIISLIRKKTRQNKEAFQGSELEALELTIKKYIDIPALNDDLDELDLNNIEYYKTHQINFSKGDAIDLKDVNNEKLPKKIAARIYKTRNSLVHSKSNDGLLVERGIYKPFKDHNELLKEIPLMKLIAETIIISSAPSL